MDGLNGFLKAPWKEKLFLINEILLASCFLSLIPNIISYIDWQIKPYLSIFFSIFFPILCFIFVGNILNWMREKWSNSGWINILLFFGMVSFIIIISLNLAKI